MVWQPEIDELNYRMELARQMGGEEGIARQYFAQLGVEIFDNWNLHLSAHRITGQQDISSGATSDHLVLDGMMYAFGLKLGW